jgi:hypothetical protein
MRRLRRRRIGGRRRRRRIRMRRLRRRRRRRAANARHIRSLEGHRQARPQRLLGSRLSSRTPRPKVPARWHELEDALIVLQFLFSVSSKTEHVFHDSPKKLITCALKLTFRRTLQGNMGGGQHGSQNKDGLPFSVTVKKKKLNVCVMFIVVHDL